DLLPHGPEFRFLDRLLSLEPGKSAAGEYAVRGDEPFLRGHFPGRPMMPGVLLVEAAAQLAGVVAQSDQAIPPLPGLKLTAIRGRSFTPDFRAALSAPPYGRTSIDFSRPRAVSSNGSDSMPPESSSENRPPLV